MIIINPISTILKEIYADFKANTKGWLILLFKDIPTDVLKDIHTALVQKKLLNFSKKSVKKGLLLVGIGVMLSMTSGCKLLNREDRPDIADPAPIVGGHVERGMPEFDIPTPHGHEKRALYGILDASGAIVVEGLKKGDRLLVTIKDAGVWFHIGPQYSGAYYYQIKDNQVVYMGLNLVGKEYCIYHFSKVE